MERRRQSDAERWSIKEPSRLVQADTVRAYVQNRLDKGWTVRAYARAAGVNHQALGRVMLGRTAGMQESTAHRLLAVEDEHLYEATTTGFVPAYMIRWKIGSLCANGWTCTQQAALLGYNHTDILRIASGVFAMVRKELAEDVDSLWDRLRNVHYTSSGRGHALKFAAKHGFRTPDAYAYDGTLWEDDVRDDEREARCARRDEEAYLHMEVARLSLTLGMSITQMVTKLRMFSASGEQAIRRARADLGVKWDGGRAYGPKPGQDERIAEILEVVDRWQAAGEFADPWPYCVELGMMTGPKWTNLEKSGKPKLKVVERRTAA
jgi:transcriptional regulator with XRE-family HTH domain